MVDYRTGQLRQAKRKGVNAGQWWPRRPRDVKNEGRTDYVHENKENNDKMSCLEFGFLRENALSEG